jgi:hypothetical protein
VEDGHLKASQAIPGVEGCIRGSRVDLSTASTFFKKSWSIYSQLVSDHVSQASTDLYDLSDHLLRMTRYCLKERSKKVKAYSTAGYNAGDILAEALCQAAREVGPPPEEPDDSSDYWVSGTPIWGSDHPISEAWAGLGSQKVPWDMEGSLRFNSGTGKWDKGPARLGLQTFEFEVDASIDAGRFSRHNSPPAPDYTDPSVVRIVRTFEKQKSCLPKLTIELEGAPVCLLMKTALTSFGSGSDSVPKDTKELWNATVRWAEVSLGLGKAGKGRPRLDQGWRAAWLHDQMGLPWSKVAQRLCRLNHPKHHATSACTVNFRKQAEQYWETFRSSICRAT